MASRSGVLVKYKNNTRKIQGDWSRRSFKNFAREIREKFDIDGAFDVQVFDKENNAYFSIDKSEMNEIRKGSMVRIVGAKGSPNAKAKGGKTAPKGKKRGAQLKPPGVPPYSKADNKARNAWKKGSFVEMYSEKANKWMKGEVLRIFNDHEGEWLVVKAGGFRTGEIQRFSNFIRVVQPKKQQTKKQQASKSKKGKTQNAEPRAPRPKKVVLPTTQSKYKKAPKPPLADSLKENEIHIKGNTQNVKKFIDRAVALLQGTAVSKKAVKSEDDDEKAEVEPKQYDTVHLFGSNRSMGAVVSVSEVVKKCVPNLHQVTTLETVTITDLYKPLEIGLKDVEVHRPLAQLRITLSLNEKDVDTKCAGYQAPTKSDVPMDRILTRGDGKGKSRGRGRGK